MKEFELSLVQPDAAALEQAASRHPSIRSLAIHAPSGRDQSAVSRFTRLEVFGAYPWKHRDFEPLRELRELQEVTLNVCGKAGDLSPFANLPRLRSLRILSATGVHDLRPLARCRQLRMLEFDHALPELRFWYHTATPLTALTSLRRLCVNGPFRQGGVRPLGRMKWLRRLALADDHVPIRELVWLAMQLPRTQCSQFEPFERTGLKCARCGEEIVRLSGRVRARMVCSRCKAGYIRAHIARFEAAKPHWRRVAR